MQSIQLGLFENAMWMGVPVSKCTSSSALVVHLEGCLHVWIFFKDALFSLPYMFSCHYAPHSSYRSIIIDRAIFFCPLRCFLIGLAVLRKGLGPIVWSLFPVKRQFSLPQHNSACPLSDAAWLWNCFIKDIQNGECVGLPFSSVVEGCLSQDRR